MQNDWLTFVNLLLITVYLSILRLLLKYNKHVEKCAHISAQLNNFFPKLGTCTITDQKTACY